MTRVRHYPIMTDEMIDSLDEVIDEKILDAAKPAERLADVLGDAVPDWTIHDEGGALMSKTRQFPRQETRVETGTIRFGDDWPGVFLRGDHALHFAHTLKSVLDNPERLSDPVVVQPVLHGLVDTLFDCKYERVKNDE